MIRNRRVEAVEIETYSTELCALCTIQGWEKMHEYVICSERRRTEDKLIIEKLVCCMRNRETKKLICV